MTYAEVMMQVANDMSEAEVNDRGLIGAASEAASPQQEQAARDLAAGKLSEMERALRGLA